MSKKLKGTAEQFMHSTYLINRFLQINEVNSASGADDATINVAELYNGEDGLVQELIPYGLVLGKMIDKVWDEVGEFPGVPAYELSDDVVAEWLHYYVVHHGELPPMGAWKQYCKNATHAWCMGKIKEFNELPTHYQIHFCVKEVDVFKLWDDARKIKEINSAQLAVVQDCSERLTADREYSQPKVSHVKTCIHAGDLSVTEENDKTVLQFNGLEVKIDGKITDVNGPGLDV